MMADDSELDRESERAMAAILLKLRSRNDQDLAALYEWYNTLSTPRKFYYHKLIAGKVEPAQKQTNDVNTDLSVLRSFAGLGMATIILLDGERRELIV